LPWLSAPGSDAERAPTRDGTSRLRTERLENVGFERTGHRDRRSTRNDADRLGPIERENKTFISGISTTKRNAHAPLARAGAMQGGRPCGIVTGTGSRGPGAEMQTFNARVSRIRSLTHDVREIELSLLEPRAIHFTPGQFVSFEIAREDGLSATRAYSIASPARRSGAIDLLLNRVPGGPGSEHLFGLHEGDVTTFKGPVGSFTLRDGARDLLFVATGTGVAPFRSMLWSLAEAGSSRAVTLFWGLRAERDLYYQEELERLRSRLPRFSFTTTLSRPDAGWHGPIGRVSPLIESRVVKVTNLDVFLCGNAAMIRDVREIIRNKGLCPIHTEEYYDDRDESRPPPC